MSIKVRRAQGTRLAQPLTIRDILPRLKAGASTVNTPAKANLRLTGALVDHRCPDGFDVFRGVVVAVNREAAVAMQRPSSKGDIMVLSTVRTDFGGWRKASNFDNRFATLGRNP